VSRVRPTTYLFFFAAFAILMFVSHAAFFDFPYYWDELGFYIPAAWDLQERGELIPTSTTPNAHPPGLRIWLAGAWSVLGSSIAVTRGAMLTVAALGLFLTFILAIRLCAGLPGAPAFGPVVLLAASPLYFMQAPLAQPEVPAMVCGLAATLAYLRGAYAWSALACVALVFTKETGVVFPLVFMGFLRRSPKQAAWFALPIAALAAWFGWLFLRTGHLFGDAAFGEYNAFYNLHPARFAIALLRRVYTLLLENFHWLGLIALANAWWKRRLYGAEPWPLLATLTAAHLVLVSALGGAVLERYLVPVLPFFYVAVAAAWSIFSERARWAHQAAMTLGLAAALWWNPPYPFPFENNLAARDQAMLFRQAAGVVDALRGDRIIATAWPLSAALQNPRFGYVTRKHDVREVPDFDGERVKRADIRPFEVFVLYTREWDPPLNWMHVGFIDRAWRGIYGYRPQMTPEECSAWLGAPAAVTFEQRGQRLDIFVTKSLVH
jgi:hypothetical protein